jgi:parvulin-like peptidyl-prolyl isomerase
MKFLIIKLILCISYILFLGLRPVVALQDKLVAVVNDEIITESDVKEYLNFLYLQISSQYKQDELNKKMREAEESAIEQLIEERLILQEAKRQNIKVDDEIIEARLQRIKDNFTSDEEFNLYLQMHKLTPADLKTKIAEQILMREIIELEVRSKIFVHPQEVTNYYTAHLDEFQEVEKLDLDSIFIRINDSKEEAEKKVQEILNLLNAGQDFAELREKYSDMPALGIVKKGELNKEIENIVFKLKINEVSVPIQTNTGFYLFKLKERIPPGEIKLREVREQIYRTIFDQKFQARFTEWLDRLKENAYILVK